MPRFLRVALTAISFGLFFGGSLAIGLLLLPLILFCLGLRGQARRRRAGRFLAFGYGRFLRWMSLVRLIRFGAIELPEALKGRPFVLIANHPSLIDVLFFLHSVRDLTCVVKAAWYRSLSFGPLLRATNYLPGPGHEDDGAGFGSGARKRFLQHLRSGHPLLIFPEGTRSAPEALRRFRQGPIELAARAQVPLVCAYIDLDRPTLGKGVPFWHVPEQTPNYAFELLDIVTPPAIEGDQAETRAALRAFSRSIEAKYRRRLPRR